MLSGIFKLYSNRASPKTQRTLFPPDDTDNQILGVWLMDYLFEMVAAIILPFLFSFNNQIQLENNKSHLTSALQQKETTTKALNQVSE